MMNFDIKRKINTLRDILVGKVPDPKAQVEQITIALIYKFMDDMDLQGVDFEGERVFFKGDYEKYAFTKIMDSGNSAQERLNLYAEGMDKMANNPDLPKLFRDILRNTYIPYRDPETLNLFLKEIAEFSYEDSEDLGNAFEYLLSIMGSQGDAGQFRTPRHIIDMMVEIIAPNKNESVLDPACGTAGFLISAYNHIKKTNVDEKGNSTLSADDKKRITANFAGYDISPDMVRLSRVNMYLHRFTTPNISEYDTLTSLDKWDDKYDVILANPPFMTPKGGIIPHSRYRVSAKRAEVLFVDYIAEHLNTNGRAAIIVPEGIVFQSQTAYKELRKFLVDDGYLYGVISLPAGVFNPYSGVKTSILLLDRKLAKEKDSILFVKLNNDGFDLGAQRREIKGNEIPDLINIFKDYQAEKDVAEQENVVIAKKTDIAGQDYILVGERYLTHSNGHSIWPIVKIGDVCQINPKKSEISDVALDTIVSFVPMADLNENRKSFKAKERKPLGEVYSSYTYFRENDILLAKVTPCFENGKSGIANDLYNGIGFGSSEFFVLRADRQYILPDYLYRLINTDQFADLGKQKMTGTGGLQRVPKDFVANYHIPLPPLTVQEEIVAEIESYQRIIDGARQVVENYKPIIKIDPAWESVKLGRIIRLASGKFLPTANRVDGDHKVYGGNGVTGTHNAYFVENSTIVIGRVGEYCGASYITEPKSWVTDNALMVTDFLTEINMDYLMIMLNQLDLHQYAKVGGQPSISQGTVYDRCIPLPSLSIQNELIQTIKEEMSIVEQNKCLIEIFQQKIKDKIAEVWGE